ncbi:RNA-binding domain-containing protein [Dothidotthia symphoricarpi CBS 119687]|uniref:RNA-binding domain-containing protein n=1 Tax=Dothidotthia symphoricarpi CBS 119687 TaxID=1392245 RepID=A0A6A6ABL0_9PLEO|nr:RNA-binding domain-containing protein [Dothidotthia symphoricarpi CBS 119687]KAF2129332.1 RNA-binding domain-containing protein [Dothidotthia symphoricarpi CBS 119687]
MAPRRKRQRLSEDGAEAVTAVATPTADVEKPTKARDTVPNGKENARRQLFVRGLAATVSTQDLTDYFSESYPIKHALVVLDKESKESKGYGFVTFADVEDAQRAREELNNTKLKGKKISIEGAEARQREGEPDRVKVGDRIKAEREQAKKDNQTPKLIIRNLPWSIESPEQLQKHFRSYGKVNFINLPKKPSGELRGFAFVSLRGRKNAEKAILELNGKEIDGRQIAVDWAVDRDAWQTQQKTERGGDDSDEDMEDAESSVVSSDEDEDDDDDEDASDDEQDDDDSNADYEDVSDSDGDGGIELDDEPKPKREEYTVFVRNLPFTVDDESLMEHFKQFGGVRFARVVLDRDTERPKGTGFVSFFSEEDMISCLRGIPRTTLKTKTTDRKDGTTVTVTHSVLEDDEQDPSGKYTIDGRVLQLSRAVDKNEATRLTTENATTRFNRDKDKRRLYLLSEGTIASNAPLYQQLSPSEIKMREESATLRRKQIQENPSLHLSLTRLSIRNVPRSITSKDLKQLARQAVVGFAADVKAGKRSKLNREETIRGGEAMLVAEKMRKKRGVGIVKQAKVVFETPAGSKVAEDTGAGRSRGYGFIEYYTHRNALMGLRWLNGHAVDYKVKGETPKSKKAAKEALEDKRKRLIAEFAIENANVVSRRSDREDKDRLPQVAKPEGEQVEKTAKTATKGGKGMKRKRDASKDTPTSQKDKLATKTNATETEMDKGKLAQRTRIIAKKRQARKAKKGGR